jgi:hypothetical protein
MMLSTVLAMLWVLEVAVGVACGAAAVKNIFTSTVALGDRPESVLLSTLLLLVCGLLCFTAVFRSRIFFHPCLFTGRVWGRGLVLIACGCMAMVIPSPSDWALAVGCVRRPRPETLLSLPTHSPNPWQGRLLFFGSCLPGSCRFLCDLRVPTGVSCSPALLGAGASGPKQPPATRRALNKQPP